jgi:dihydrofolate reductase
LPSSRWTRRWPPGPSFWAGESELADRLNSLPKYVLSATLANPAWNNSTVLKGDVLNEVWTLKQHRDGDIVIAGSFQLVRTLIEHDLVDELRLKIFPVALGAGERLFGETSDKKPARLLDTPDPRGRHRLPHLPICPGRLAPHGQQVARRRPQPIRTPPRRSIAQALKTARAGGRSLRQRI